MRESLALAAICMADLLSTLVLVGRDYASEGNPIMAYYLQIGIGVFILVKLLLVILPVFVLEWAKQFAPQFTKRLTRVAIVAYVSLYFVLFLGFNVNPLIAGERVSTSAPVHYTYCNVEQEGSLSAPPVLD